MTIRRVASILTLACIAMTSACTSDGDGDDDTPPTAPITAASTTTTEVEPIALSFSDNARRGPVELGEGWSAARCEGDAPLLCITKAGAVVGKVELAVFPVESIELEGFQEAVAANDVEEAMTIIAAGFVRDLGADRKDGCGSDYELEASDVEPATVLGRPGLRYGYVGTKDGKRVERQASHGTIDGDDVVLVNTPGYAPDGCVPPEGEFDLPTLEAFLPLLGPLVAASTR